MVVFESFSLRLVQTENSGKPLSEVLEDSNSIGKRRSLRLSKAVLIEVISKSTDKTNESGIK
jgi:hypothetical protein